MFVIVVIGTWNMGVIRQINGGCEDSYLGMDLRRGDANTVLISGINCIYGVYRCVCVCVMPDL